MSIDPVTTTTTAKPAPDKKEIPASPGRTREQVLTEVAEDAVVRPEQYLKESLAPTGE